MRRGVSCCSSIMSTYTDQTQHRTCAEPGQCTWTYWTYWTCAGDWCNLGFGEGGHSSDVWYLPGLTAGYRIRLNLCGGYDKGGAEPAVTDIPRTCHLTRRRRCSLSHPTNVLLLPSFLFPLTPHPFLRQDPGQAAHAAAMERRRATADVVTSVNTPAVSGSSGGGSGGGGGLWTASAPGSGSSSGSLFSSMVVTACAARTVLGSANPRKGAAACLRRCQSHLSDVTWVGIGPVGGRSVRTC